MNTENSVKQKTRTEYRFDESMRWREYQSLDSPAASESSVIVFSRADNEIKSNEDTLGAISRIPSFSELREPIMAGFISNELKEDEEKVRSSEMQPIMPGFINNQAKEDEDNVRSSDMLKKSNRVVSLNELREAPPAFNFDFERHERQFQGRQTESVHSEDGLPAWEPFSQRRRKILSSPRLELFNCQSVFEKVGSMHADILPATPTICAEDEQRIKDLEAKCAELQDNVNQVVSERIKAEEKAKKDADDFQNTIDQLVEQVVRLENEGEEKRGMLNYVWEESQIAQQAAKHRRRMITSMRRDHQREIKKLKQQLHKQNMGKKSSEMWPGFQQSAVPEMKDQDVDLTIAEFMGNYISPLKEKRKTEGTPSRGRTPGKWLLKPESDSNDQVLTKLAERGFEDSKIFELTVVERSPAKVPIVTSFEIVEPQQNAEISDLIYKLKSAAPQDTNQPATNFPSPTEENELAGFGEKVAFNSGLLNLRANYHISQPRERPEHHRIRSFSAPPNRVVAISLLRSFQRSFKKLNIPKDNNNNNTRRLSRKIEKDARNVVRRTSRKPNRKKRRSRDIRPSRAPTTSYGKVSGISSSLIDENTIGGLHHGTGESRQLDELPQYSNMEPRSQRPSDEWKDYSQEDFDCLTLDLSNQYSTQPISLSMEPQKTITLSPSLFERSTSSGRLSRARSFSKSHERHERSPSFTY